MVEPNTVADQGGTQQGPMQPVTQPGRGRVWLGVLVLLGCVVVLAHLLGLRAIWANSEDRSSLRGEQQEWSAKQTERMKLKNEWDRLEVELNDQISKMQAKLAALHAEAVSAQTDRDRVVGDLTQRKEELTLIRKASDEAVTQQQQAQREKDQVDQARKEAESLLAGLSTEEKKLKTSVEQLRGDQDRLQKSLEATGISLQRSVADLTTAKDRSDAVDKERRSMTDEVKKVDEDLQTARKTLAEVQALVGTAKAAQVRLVDETKASKDLVDELARQKVQLLANIEAATKDQARLDKDLAERRTELHSLAEEQALVGTAKAAQVRLVDETKASRDLVDELARQKIQLLANIEAATKDQGRLDKDLAERRAELRSLQEEIRQLQEQRKREAPPSPPQTQPGNG